MSNARTGGRISNKIIDETTWKMLDNLSEIPSDREYPYPKKCKTESLLDDDEEDDEEKVHFYNEDEDEPPFIDLDLKLVHPVNYAMNNYWKHNSKSFHRQEELFEKFRKLDEQSQENKKNQTLFLEEFKRKKEEEIMVKLREKQHNKDREDKEDKE